MVTEPPHFSAIIPLYNKQRHVGRAIASAQQALAGRPHEIVVVDDGSTDAGAAVVARLAAEDPAIRLIAQPNRGRAAACNAGAAAARGTILLFLDADDEWTPDHAAVIEALAERHPEAGAFGTAHDEVTPEGHARRNLFRHVPTAPEGGLLGAYFAATAAAADPLSSSSLAVRRAVYLALGGYPERPRIGEDRLFHARLALDTTIAWSPAVTAVHRRDADNRMMNTWHHGDDAPLLDFYAGLLARPDLPAGLRRPIAALRAKQLGHVVKNLVWRGERRAALPYLAALAATARIGTTAGLAVRVALGERLTARLRRTWLRLRGIEG